MKDAVTQGIALLTTYGMNMLGGILILLVGRMVANWVEKRVDRWLSSTGKVDETLRPFLRSVAKYFVLIVTVLAVLAQFGIETTSLIAVFGAAGLAIGLALQGTLSNIAAGVMLLIFRPFKVGEFVEVAGIAGTVKSITLFVTELATPDNVQILAPNSQVWGTIVKNFSYHPTRRVDLVMGIDYGDDIDKAMQAIHTVVKADERVLADPAPQIVVGNLGESSVDLIVRVWSQAGDYWPLKFHLTKTLKERFDEEGISIPFPQRTVHMVQSSG